MCPEETAWIHLAAGEITGTRSDELHRHADACPACTDRRESARAVHEALGAWQVTPRGEDLSPAIIAAAEKARPRFAAGWWMRAAAAILVCAGTGFVAGRGTSSEVERRPAVAVTEEQLFAALGFDAMVEQADLLGTIDWTLSENVRQQ